MIGSYAVAAQRVTGGLAQRVEQRGHRRVPAAARAHGGDDAPREPALGRPREAHAARRGVDREPGDERDALARGHEREHDAEVVGARDDARLEAGGAAGGDHDAVARRVEVAGDPALVGQRRQRDLRAGGRVPGGHGDVDRRPRPAAVSSMLGSSARGLKSYSWMTATSTSPSFSAGSASSGSSSASRTSARGWRAAKAAIARGTSVAAAVGKAARRTLAAHLAVAGGELGLGRLELGQHALGAPDEQPRGGRQAHAAPLALEQGDAGLALERGEVLGDRGGV